MIAIVSHDAGGAEIISSYVKQLNLECLFVLDGPAKSIFERKLGPVSLTNLKDAIRFSEWVLCGTSGVSNLELKAIQLAKKFNKHSVAFLDHWINYKARFIRDNICSLPDEIWVGDQAAQDLARTFFPHIPICLVDNPYFKDIKAQLTKLQPNNPNQYNVLYVSEPIKEQARQMFGNPFYRGYIEDDALSFFLKNLNALKQAIDNITIRLHPAEKEDKYNWVYDRLSFPIKISKNKNLLDDILNSQVIVGCNTMAMAIGLIAGKRVICSIPPGEAECIIPLPGIELLQGLI